MLNPSPPTLDTTARALLVEQLRRRYLDGTLEEHLLPDKGALDRLLADLFPEVAARWA
ncbi:MAG: hypothetical protein JXX28_16720 [Deltaproteobacteria bacterium]|nr:hypothetical protein [Deltaproteobacteria bacterium]